MPLGRGRPTGQWKLRTSSEPESAPPGFVMHFVKHFSVSFWWQSGVGISHGGEQVLAYVHDFLHVL